jgi:hypothetical protein
MTMTISFTEAEARLPTHKVERMTQLDPRGSLTVVIKYCVYFLQQSMYSLFFGEPTPYRPPENRQKPPLASRTLQNP